MINEWLKIMFYMAEMNRPRTIEFIGLSKEQIDNMEKSKWNQAWAIENSAAEPAEQTQS